MANKIVTAKVFSKTLIKSLEKEVVWPQLVNATFNEDFQNRAGGNVIYIPKITKFEAKDFDTEVIVQDINEGEVPLELNVFKDVTFGMTVSERTLRTKRDNATFAEKYIVPARDALIAAMEQKIADQCLTVSNYISGFSGVPSSMADLTKIKAALTKLGLPTMGRRAVVGTDTAAAMVGAIPQLADASQSGETQGVLEANIGRKAGIDFYESAYLLEDAKDPEITGGAVNGAVVDFDGQGVIKLDGLTDAETFHAGQIITFSGGAKAAIAETQTISGTEHDLVCYNLIGDVADDETFTIVKMGASVAFGKNSIAFASVPLAIEDDNCVVSTAENNPALYIRVSQGKYDVKTKKTLFSLDFLAGTKVVNKHEITRFGGL